MGAGGRDAPRRRPRQPPVRTDAPLPVVAQAGLATLGVALQGVTRFAYSVAIGRVAGPEPLAQVNGAIAVAMITAMVWPSAAGAAANRYLGGARGPDRANDRAAVATHLLRRLAVAVPLLAVAGAVAAVAVLGVDPGTSVLVGALVLVQSGYLVVRGAQAGTGRIASATGAEAVSAAVSLLLLAVVLAADEQRLLLLPLVVGLTLYCLLAVLGSRLPSTHTAAHVSRPLRRDIDAFVGWGVLGNLASAGLLQLSLVLAVLVAPAQQAGYYAAAVSLATPASLLARSASLVLVPSMAAAGSAEGGMALRRQTDLATRAGAVVFVALFGGLLLAAEPVLLVVYGPSFVGAADELRLLVVAVLLGTLAVPAVARLTSAGASGVRASAVFSSAGAVGGAIGMVTGAGAYGTAGIAAGYLLGTAVSALWPLEVVRRRDGMRWQGLGLRVAGALVLAAALTIAEQALRLPPIADCGLAVAFGVGWTALARPDLRRVLPHIRAAR